MSILSTRDGLVPAAIIPTLARLAEAAYGKNPVPAGFDSTTILSLGIHPDYLGLTDDGDTAYRKENASAIVVARDGGLTVAITGTDEISDALDWLSVSDSYYENLRFLRDALKQRLDANPAETLMITGHSLGAAAAELLLKDLSAYGERVHAVTFASPLATLTADFRLLNIGFENDPIYKITPFQIDGSDDATEHLMLALEKGGGITAHAVERYVEASAALSASRYLSATAHDTYVVVAQGRALADPPGWFGEIDSKGLLVVALPGDTLLEAGGGRDSLEGGIGNDTLLCRADADLAFGGAGDDVIYGHTGADQLAGGDGRDLVFAGQDADLAYGNAGDDAVYGNLAADTLFGGGGGDTLYGGQGADVMYGGGGDDMLIGNRDDDTLSGGEGADVFLFRGAFGADTILDFDAAAGDRLDFGGAAVTRGADNDQLLLIADGGRVLLIGIAPDADISFA